MVLIALPNEVSSDFDCFDGNSRDHFMDSVVSVSGL